MESCHNDVTHCQRPKESLTGGTHEALHGVDTSWRIAAIAALTVFVSAASSTCSGFFYVSFMQHFNITRESASLPISLITSIGSISALLNAVLEQWMPLRKIAIGASIFIWIGMMGAAFSPNIAWMAFTYGFISGAGFGIMLVALSVTLVTYFDKYRGVATGFKYAGWSLSGIVFPKILSYLQDQYGIQGTLLIYSAMATHCTAFVLLLPNPARVKKKDNKGEQTAARNHVDDSVQSVPPNNNITDVCAARPKGKLPDALLLFRMPIFYALIVYCAWADCSMSAVTPTLVDHIMDKGSSRKKADNMIVYTAATELVGRLLIPLLADKKLLGRSTLVMSNFFCLAVTSLVLPELNEYSHMVTVCAVQSLLLGCVTTMKGVLLADYIGVSRVSVTFGLAGVLVLPFTFINPAIIGLFRDSQGTYDNLYRLHGCIHFAIGVLFVFIVWRDRKRSKSCNIPLELDNSSCGLR